MGSWRIFGRLHSDDGGSRARLVVFIDREDCGLFITSGAQVIAYDVDSLQLFTSNSHE